MENINSNLLTNLYNQNALPSLQLTQIDGFTPVEQFTDSDGQVWKLVKSASSGMSEVPDPKSLNILDFWNHEFPGTSSKIFIYVVEGIRIPKTQRESACKVMYVWFSTVNNKTFSPSMIKNSEWLTANVYAAPMLDSRISKLKALCKIKDQQETQTVSEMVNPVEEQPAPLIKMDFLNDRISKSETETISSDNRRKCRSDNK